MVQCNLIRVHRTLNRTVNVFSFRYRFALSWVWDALFNWYGRWCCTSLIRANAHRLFKLNTHVWLGKFGPEFFISHRFNEAPFSEPCQLVAYWIVFSGFFQCLIDILGHIHFEIYDPLTYDNKWLCYIIWKVKMVIYFSSDLKE